ncbi:MAG: hypothetical protein Q9170_007188 [Blastenia crenularia]
MNEYKAAAKCLAEAFQNDDVAQYFVRTADTETWSDEDRYDLHERIMRCLVHAHIVNGLALTAGPNYESVALWLEPGQDIDDPLQMQWSGLPRLEEKLSNEGKYRFQQEFLTLLHRTKTEVLGIDDDDSWYLVYLGTKPDAQKRGYGRMLIEYGTKQADAAGQKCYLESSNEVNPAVYSRYGFEKIQEIELKRGSKPIKLDIMVRYPNP